MKVLISCISGGFFCFSLVNVILRVKKEVISNFGDLIARFIQILPVIWPLELYIRYMCVLCCSISDQTISSVAFNKTGDWIALACSGLGQLLVWEWQSETYVLKQQGHFNNISCLSYSPDGQFIATGGEDGKVKHSQMPVLEFVFKRY